MTEPKGSLFLIAFVLLLGDSSSTLPLGILKEIHDYYTGFPPPPKGLLGDADPLRNEYDFVIVGAGSGGSVLANRLTEIHQWNVLLLEAGKDEIFLTDIPLFAPLMQITAYNWGYKTEPSGNGSSGYCLAMIEGRCNWPRGKAVGGTSVINYMIHSRGSQADYDAWSALGNPGWSYEQVLPYFERSENVKFDDNTPGIRTKGKRGKNGYLDVTTVPYVSPLRDSFLRAGEEIGYSLKDYNDRDPLGFGPAQVNLRNGRRVSASKAFLRPIRYRANLHLSKHSKVTKIIIDPKSKTAVGVEFIKNRQRYFVKAKKEVLLSAGTLNSPQLLMLSGVGPRKHLEDLGIGVIEDLPVGYNLQDHTSMGALTFLVNETITIVESRVFSDPANTLKYLTKGKGPLTLPGGAEAIAFVNTKRKPPLKPGSPKKKSLPASDNSFNSLESPLATESKAKNSSFSNGQKTSEGIIEKAPEIPDIELVLGSGSLTGDASGSLRSIYGISEEWYERVFHEYKGLDAFSIVPVLLHPKSRGRVKLRSANPFYWPVLEANYFDDQDDLDTMVRGIKKAIEVASTRAFERFNTSLLPVTFPGCNHLEFNTDEYWSCAARQVSTTLGHFVGTCKMSPRENEGVVDARLRVHGIKGLRVVDASIMPLLVSGHTNAPTYMIGEKASDMIKQDWLTYDKSFK
ncbi:glucose dehydrogenase [FAD, quinone]-like [Venturia canescens]|uniref:glucose dehydrogenase [FAD, quinone]-like n=1 Tax=Venturia canescens TaxID=32260 RepID=UPI001C9C785C|nr:glucose dehydrogenase [FAD, quinone]-like [Venturia canescens]XP_043271045.1 glucose dehydrogenase [FAD, quinone]-like [Venturia canescens]